MTARRWRWPLRRRLVAVMLAVVSSMLVATALGFMVLMFSTLYDDVDARLKDAQAAATARYPYAGDGRGSAVLTEVAIQIVDANGESITVLQRQNRGGPELPTQAEVVKALAEEGPATIGPPGSPWRLLAQPLPDGTWLVVGQPVAGLQVQHSNLVAVWAAGTLLALVVTLALTVIVVRYGLRPLTRLADQAGQIEADNLSQRLTVASKDEVGQLAAALNSMLERIDTSLQQRQAVEERLRRFVHDAGHELRTPVTAIRGWADLYRKGGVTVAEVPTAMRRIEEETQRIGALVDELLLLASLDDAAAPATAIAEGEQRRLVDMSEVVRDAILDAQAIQPHRQLTCDLPLPAMALVYGQAMALHQVVANLLANVAAHTPPDAAAHVELRSVGDDVMLRVSDDGPGVPEPLRDKVFDRFFRADAGRAHLGAGGSGLGLSIVAAIVASHGGEVCAEPVTKGFAIRVSLPAAQAR